jgi:hypothetical protein
MPDERHHRVELGLCVVKGTSTSARTVPKGRLKWSHALAWVSCSTATTSPGSGWRRRSGGTSRSAAADAGRADEPARDEPPHDLRVGSWRSRPAVLEQSFDGRAAHPEPS